MNRRYKKTVMIALTLIVRECLKTVIQRVIVTLQPDESKVNQPEEDGFSQVACYLFAGLV